jgi:alpha-amylase
VRDQVLSSITSSASGQPLIYGSAAALTVSALKFRQKNKMAVSSWGAATQSGFESARWSGRGAASSPGLEAAEALELAAAEMAVAAAALVAAEKRVAAATQALIIPDAAPTTDGEDVGSQPELSVESLVWAQSEMELLETARAEAGLCLERRMAAMEAALASRRPPRESISERLAETRRREMMHGFGGRDVRFDPGHPGVLHGAAAPLPSDEDLPSAAGGTGPGVGNGGEIILQGFNWDSCKSKPSWYEKLAGAAEAIAAAGFTIVWLPPGTNSVSPQGYLPRDLYDLNSAYGSEGALRGAIRTLHEARIKCVADIVINHRCAHAQKNGKWNQFGGRLAWDESAICRGNEEYGGTGAPNSGEPYPAAPNIDHGNAKVRSSLSDWLSWMRGVGFDGWRFDYVKGYSGEYTRQYINASVPKIAFGEYWDACSYTNGVLDYNQDAHRQRIVNWCDRTGGTAAAFDFTTKVRRDSAVTTRWTLRPNTPSPPPPRAHAGRSAGGGGALRVLAAGGQQRPHAWHGGHVGDAGGYICGEPRHWATAGALAVPPAGAGAGVRVHPDTPGHAVRVLGPLGRVQAAGPVRNHHAADRRAKARPHHCQEQGGRPARLSRGVCRCD